MTDKARFARTIGVDYSGAATADARLPGLRVYVSEVGAEPIEIRPECNPRRHCTRRGLAQWLAQQLSGAAPVIVGVDHSFSFPLDYFEKYGLNAEWEVFLADFQAHWPSDQAEFTVECLRPNNGRTGDSRWRRRAEVLCRAKSVFHFDVQGSVAKSTHAGLPWLLHLRRALGPRLHVWPYDGWAIPTGRSVPVEAYPTLCRQGLPRADRTADQQDAYAVASWLAREDHEGRLPDWLEPTLTEDERTAAAFEGWILGV